MKRRPGLISIALNHLTGVVAGLVAATSIFEAQRKIIGVAGASPMGAKLGDSRAALPLPACHQGVYARRSLSLGPPKAGPDGRAMERSEFAHSSRKFRVRGPLHESELCGKAPSPSTSPPLWRGPLTPTLSPQAGRGSRKARTRSYLSADGDKPGGDKRKVVRHDRNAL
jgi:hypothetical protein